MTEIFTLETTDLLFLFDGFGKHSGLRALLQNIVVIVDVENEISSVLFGEGDAFVVNQAGVLVGIDAGADSVFDGLLTMSKGGDFTAKFVGFLRDCLHLFESVLSVPG